MHIIIVMPIWYHCDLTMQVRKSYSLGDYPPNLQQLSSANSQDDGVQFWYKNCRCCFSNYNLVWSDREGTVKQMIAHIIPVWLFRNSHVKTSLNSILTPTQLASYPTNMHMHTNSEVSYQCIVSGHTTATGKRMVRSALSNGWFLIQWNVHS